MCCALSAPASFISHTGGLDGSLLVLLLATLAPGNRECLGLKTDAVIINFMLFTDIGRDPHVRGGASA